MLGYFIKTFLSYGAVRVIAQIISFLLIPIVTKRLLPEEYSAIEYVSIINTILITIVGMQLGSSVGRLLADASDDSQKNKIISTGFYATLFFMSISCVVLCISYFATRKQFFFTNSFSSLFYLNIALYFFLGLYHYLNNILTWKLESKKVVIVNTLYILMGLVTTIYFVIIQNKHITGSYYSMLISIVVTVGILLLFCKKSIRHNFDFSVFKALFKYALPLIFTTLLLNLWTLLDRNIILHYFGETNLGIYALALKFASVLILAYTIVESIINPLVTQQQENETTKKLLSDLYLIHIVGLFLALVFVTLFGKELIDVFIDIKFKALSSILFFVLISQTFLKITYFTPGFILGKKNTIFLLVTSVFAIVNFSFNILWGRHLSFSTMLSINAVFALIYFFCAYSLSQKYYSFYINIPITLLLLFIAWGLFYFSTYYSIQIEYRILMFVFIIFLLPFLLLKTTKKILAYLKQKPPIP